MASHMALKQPDCAPFICNHCDVHMQFFCLVDEAGSNREVNINCLPHQAQCRLIAGIIEVKSQDSQLFCYSPMLIMVLEVVICKR